MSILLLEPQAAAKTPATQLGRSGMKAADESLLVSGGYARKQLVSRSRLVTFSHGARFRLARKLVEPFAGERLLDYGCGDGTFLVLVHDLFPSAVGADVNAEQTRDCTQRLGVLGGLTFTSTGELHTARHAGRYGVVMCMEVLEHCPEAERTRVLTDLRRLVGARGRLVMSVPLEVGPSLVCKHLFRAVAAWRNLGDYRDRETYGPVEFMKMVCAGERTAIRRPMYHLECASGQGLSYHGHKGFNWRTLRNEIERLFVIEQMLFTPVGWLGASLNSQAWFVCTPRPGPGQERRMIRLSSPPTGPASA